MQATIKLKGGEVIADLDHLPFTLDVQKSVTSKLYGIVIDALAKLGEAEIARRNRMNMPDIPGKTDAVQK